MPFLCNVCSEVIDTSCGIHEHVATKHSGLSLCECFHCHGTGYELSFQNFDDLAKHSAIKHPNEKCKAIYVRSIEAFILKHINEIEQDQVTTSQKNDSSSVAKQEVKKDGRADLIDLTDDYVDSETFDNAPMEENIKSIVEPGTFQSSQVVAAVPVDSVILENRNVLERASVFVKTETSPNLACGQIVPDNQVPMQNSVNIIEPFPIGHNEDSVINQSNADNQSNVAPVTTFPIGHNETIIDQSMTNYQSIVAPITEMPSSVVPPSCNDFALIQSDNSELNILSVNLPGAQANGVNENIKCVDTVSVTVTETSSYSACDQVPSDNHVLMQDQMDTGEEFEVSILSVKMKEGKAKSNPIIIKEEVPTSPKLNVPKKVQKRAQRRVTCKKRYPCSVCDKRFWSLQMACEHKKVIHDHGEKHKCDQCGKEYSYKNDYQTHMMRHKKGMLFCDDCGKETGSRSTLINHTLLKHLKKAYKCKLCDKTFALKSHMKRHRHSVHLKERPFICDYCDRPLVTKSALYGHWAAKHY